MKDQVNSWFRKTSMNTDNLKNILKTFIREAAACVCVCVCVCVCCVCACVRVCRVKQRSKENKMMIVLALANKERLSEKVKMNPCLYDKMTKGYKEKDVLQNSWNTVAELLEFVEDGTCFSMLQFLSK